MPDFLGLSPLVMAASLGLFCAIVLGIYGVGGMIIRDSSARRLGVQTSAVRLDVGGKLYDSVVRPLEKTVVPRSGKEAGTVRRQLVRAGWYAPQAVAAYFVIRLLSGMVLPTLFNLTAPLVMQTTEIRNLLMGSIAAAITGYLMPALVVNHRTTKRQTAVRRGFPDALDLLLVCVEAGLGLDGAINRVAQEIGTAHPLLREHFHLMALELQTGKSRQDALRSFGERIGVDEADVLVSLLIQTDALGSSIADTLRALSDDMRAKRMLAAEEKAQQVGVKLTFPLILLIMPALMVTIGAPAILQIIRQMGPVMARLAGK